MILAKSALEPLVHSGRIVIDPFDPARLNASSYTFTIADALYEVVWRPGEDRPQFDWRLVELVDGAWALQPQKLYLATTAERIGSDEFAVRLTGRPALGLSGLFVQVTADLGHQGAKHKWTLELVTILPILLRPLQPIGQASFWQTSGPVSMYQGEFGSSDVPLRSKLHRTMTP